MLYRVARKVGLAGPSKTADYFSDLVETIICQQLSDKAGATIFERFVNLFPQQKVTPGGVLALTNEKIRSVGPSWSKVNYIKNLAAQVTKSSLKLNTLHKLNDEEVISQLTKVKGIGRWTAEMFLMFSLGRKDVFSHGDLGLRRAIQRLYKFKHPPSQKKIEKIVAKWSPYRTYACRVLWRSLGES